MHNGPKDDSLLYFSFSPDQTSLVVGTETGFRIYDLNPLKLRYQRILNGGIGIIEMLHKKNIYALVGGGKSPKYTPNKVILWDDYQTKILNEFKLTSSVKNIKLKPDKIIIVCEQRIYIYNLDKFKLLETIETFKNEVGCIGLNSDLDFTVMGYPITPAGFLKVKYYEKSQELDINAHNSPINCISINSDGSLVATASCNGHIVRVFCIANGQFIEEFRRGKDKASINNISFDEYSNWMAVCCEKGQINIFSMGSVWQKVYELGGERTKIPKIQEELPKNNQSMFKNLPGFLKMGTSADKSYAHIEIENQPAICAIYNNNDIIAISGTGKYYLAKIEIKKSPAGKLNVINFMIIFFKILKICKINKKLKMIVYIKKENNY